MAVPVQKTIIDLTDGGAYHYSNDQLANLYFPNEEGRVKCIQCDKKVAVGNGFTNRIQHIKGFSGHKSEWELRLLEVLKTKKRNRTMLAWTQVYCNDESR